MGLLLMHLIQKAHQEAGYSIRELLNLFDADKRIPIDPAKRWDSIITAPENGSHTDPF